jgi:putative copper export protein
VFTVGVPVDSAAAAPPDVHAAEEAPAAWGPTVAGAPLVPAALRGLAVGSLMALAGVLALAAWPRAGGEPAPRRTQRLASALAVAASLLLALHATAWLLTASPDHRLTGEVVSAAAEGGAGRVELWRVALAVLALWALALARRPLLALAFAVGALLASGAAGHPAAIHPAWAIPAKALHLLAGAAWLGGLLALSMLLAPAGHEPADAAPLAHERLTREAGRVSTLALGAVVLVTLSGVAQALLFLPSPAELLRSAYGALVLAKAAGLLALAGFGAHHRFRVLPRLAHDGTAAARRFAVSLRGEVAVMALVILLGGFLAYVPPPALADAATNGTAGPTSTTAP